MSNKAERQNNLSKSVILKSTKQQIGKPSNNNSATKPKRLHAHVDNETKHVATISTKKKIKFQNATLSRFVTTTIDKKHTNHKEEKNNNLQKLMIESSTQENGILESRLNFPTTLTALLENLVVVENISSIKSSRVSVCGIKELESNVMQKPRVNLIQYPNYSCASVYTSSQTQKVP